LVNGKGISNVGVIRLSYPAFDLLLGAHQVVVPRPCIRRVLLCVNDKEDAP